MCRWKTALAVMTTMAVAMATALVVGCVPESLSKCGPVEVVIDTPFDPPAPGSPGDPDAGTMRSIRFYVFDTATGVLAAIVSVSEDEMARGSININSLSDGVYTFVAWGGGNDSTNIPPGFSTQAVIGMTTIDNFMMTLDLASISDGGPGEATPAKEDFDDLFFAIAKAVTVKSNSPTVIPLQFTRNSNILRVTVKGLELLSGTNTRAETALDIFAVGRNGRYSYDNTIDESSPLVRYSPLSTTISDGQMNVGIKTLRLDIDTHSDDPVLLYVRSATTKEDLIYPLDVLDAILSIPDENGLPLYTSQEDIDRTYEFNILVEIIRRPGGTISVIITIDGWEIERLIPNLPALDFPFL